MRRPTAGTMAGMIKVDSAIGRAVVRMAGSKRFLRVAPMFIPRIDRIVHKASGGRFVISSGMVPSLVLTCRGAKTGEPRVIPLACMPDTDGSWYVVGSNFGRPDHPAWTANLLTNPDATVTYRGKEISVRAELQDEAARDAVWPRLLTVWPNYAAYQEHAGGRPLRVFHLIPTS